MSPSVNNGFIRSPGKTPGLGGSSTLGEGGWDPWGDSHCWKELQRETASPPIVQLRKQAQSGADNPKGT